MRVLLLVQDSTTLVAHFWTNNGAQESGIKSDGRLPKDGWYVKLNVLSYVAAIPAPVAMSAQRTDGPHRRNTTDPVDQGKDGTGVAYTEQQLHTVDTSMTFRRGSSPNP